MYVYSSKVPLLFLTETTPAALAIDHLEAAPQWDSGVSYALATMLLRLPGHAPMLAFNHVVDIPLIAPQSKHSRQQVWTVEKLADSL